MNTILKKLFAAADNHGEDSGEPDHVVGDLQDLLREAWTIMTFNQKVRFLASRGVEDVTELGARDAFEADELIDELRKQLSEMESAIENAGYSIVESGPFYCWESADGDVGEDFNDREDAVASAYASMRANTPQDAERRSVKVVVLCSNSSGEPEFYPCTLSVTPQEFEDGGHYELAKEKAANDGFEGPMLAFTPEDSAGKQLGNLLAWV